MENLNESELFNIELEHLKDIEVFPFHLYVYNPSKKAYNLYLEANTPLSEQKLTFIQYILQRKGRLAISNNQKNTFLNHMKLSGSDIPSLSDNLENAPASPTGQEGDIPVSAEANIVIDFDFEDEFIQADHMDDYSRLISAMKQEVSRFSLKMNHTVSLATYFVNELCNEDNLTNRVVALSYFLTKEAKIKDTESLSDIVVAAFLYHLGYTQMDMKMSTTPQLLMGDRMSHEYKKHLGLSQHLIGKSGIDLSVRCKKIINEHHERSDGNGYPNSKSKYQVDPLALILGCASHLIEFSMGQIDGNKQRILPLIKILEKGDQKPGLETQFGDHIIEHLVSIVKNEFTEEAA